MFFHPGNLTEVIKFNRRAKSLARTGSIDPSNELSTLWTNIKMFIDTRENGDDWRFDLNLLAFFSHRFDEYSKTHMVSGDESIGQMMLEWREYSQRIADFDHWQDGEPCPVKPKDRINIENGIWLENININGLHGEARAYSCCGMLYQTSRLTSTIDRGHINGEYGERLSKPQQREMMLWSLSHCAKNAPDSCWSLC